MAKPKISHPTPDSQALALQNVFELPQREETIHSLGATHAADGLIEYLRQASPNSLSNMFMRNAGEMAERRREFVTVVESWLDALAIQKFIAWQTRQPRKVNAPAPAAVRVPMPADVDPAFDPFFRHKAESDAIRRELKCWQLKRWPEHFRRFGCLGKECDTRENYSGSGYCTRCHGRITSRLADIDADLRLDAARGR